EQPLRSELFSLDQMQGYGKTLAESHEVNPSGVRSDRLLGRLLDNESVLNEVRVLLTERASVDRRMVPAADWFLDNFYLIEEHIRTSKRDLPKGYSRGLPRLLHGSSAGLPRAYDIALERISHGDGLVDPDTLIGFLTAYQSVSVLTLGELWAIPIMLRLALIENLRRVAVRISTEIRAQGEADSWADRMTQMAVSDPKNLILLIADMARSDPPMVGSFVAELARKLQGKGPALSLPLKWIEQRLSETGLTIERVVQTAMQQQAADQVSVSNSIRSLRSLGATDWKEFVESTSVVEAILRSDPAGAYGRMDFATRDRYRHVVEETARRGRITESEVARLVVDLACDHSQVSNGDDRSAHVGYYLVDKGFERLRRAAHLGVSVSYVAKNLGQGWILSLYVGAALLLALAIACGLVAGAAVGGLNGWPILLFAALALLCAGAPSIALVNWIVSMSSVPHSLPRMDFSEGVPEESLTLAVVPAMLSSKRHIDLLVDALEVRWLANRDDNLFFGLLTDLPDAAEETLASDAALVHHARLRIEALNDSYSGTPGASFFLFHRGRRWNDRERHWMGHERKRGKLSDLNALLREGATERFELLVGRIERLPKVKYVITLDTDTQLPRDSARNLSGTMAHPLNRARYDAKRGRVVEGYGILQPRVATSLPGASRSRFARLNGNEPGIDPYTRAISDVYQDLFGEGSFIGKGIYDVDAFELALKGRFPDNRILSHDLLEGCYARSGLVSDIQLFEESPATYLDDVDRRRRWVRGDWQLLRWLLPYVAARDGGSRRNALSALSKFKIFDNLRRSLSAAATTLLLIVGWTVLSNHLVWTLSVVGLVLIPSLSIGLVGLLRKSGDTQLGSHLATAIRAPAGQLAQGLLTLVFLPYEASFSLTAIARTAWRLLITRRRLLEWSPSDEHYRRGRRRLLASYRTMWFAPLLALGAGVLLRFAEPAAIAASLPLLALWFLSPGVAWWI
ncbi:MAG TPA: cyclic beta 1-2 glucan synthetase, partial [Spirochaetia bacterium]|nr:cyclic beta 1-2 glucan synthetase [Spirochaetia bacterium]